MMTTIYAVLDDAAVVVKLAAVLYGERPIDARGRTMVRTPTAPFPGGPVCAGWRLRGGRWHSPPDENGFSAFSVVACAP